MVPGPKDHEGELRGRPACVGHRPAHQSRWEDGSFQLRRYTVWAAEAALRRELLVFIQSRSCRAVDGPYPVGSFLDFSPKGSFHHHLVSKPLSTREFW